ncbi:MAG: transglutaminase family protein [bacterium]|nr:transglutaminase family protein [bacterium]
MSDSPTVPVDDLEACLRPSRFIDSGAPEVIAYARRAVGHAEDEVEQARRLYLAVRDDLPYNPYITDHRWQSFTASRTLASGRGFCVTKAAVLAAAARARGIPARLGFADVRNHLTSPRLQKLMGGTDVFAYHGYTDLHLRGRWVKATPAFNLSLCQRANIRPLEFDGENDSIYHPFDALGRRHLEYIRYRGVHLDIPFEEMMTCFAEMYDLTAARMAVEAAGAEEFEREVTTT